MIRVAHEAVRCKVEVAPHLVSSTWLPAFPYSRLHMRLSAVQ
jgi:hypothetical protein